MSNRNRPSLAGSNGFPVSPIGGRSWTWLLELCRPLNVGVQLVDPRMVPVLPTEPGTSDELHKVIASGAPQVKAAISAALQTRRPQFVVVGSVHALCAPLMTPDAVAGALVIGKVEPAKESTTVTRARLERVGAWLTVAVEGHLGSPIAPTANLLPLFRVLDRTVERGADRDLVSVFAEALAVWHDVEVVGYVEASPGVFAREVSLAGRTQPARPLVLPPAAVPPPLQMERMPRGDIEGSSTPVSTQDVIVTTLSHEQGAPSWLLVLSGALDACDAQLLANYVAVLDSSIARAIEASKASTVNALLGLLLGGDEDFRTTAGAVLAELRQRLKGSSAKLSLESREGTPILSVSSTLTAVPDSDSSGRDLTIVRRLMGQHRLVVLVSRTEDSVFTPLEHQVGSAAATVLETWTQGVALRRSRKDAPGFGLTMEQLAKEALERGTVVTAVVVSTAQQSGAASAEKWVDEIRRRMRQSDAVGILPAGEIGLLLYETTAAHAKAVTRRLQGALAAAGDRSAAIRSIGFATRMPGQGVAEGIVQDAKSNARDASNGDPHSGVR